MLSGYRRRFVAINMALIALVLALALGMQLVHTINSLKTSRLPSSRSRLSIPTS